MISAVIIVKNESLYLDGCLDSLEGLDEIVVFDNGEVPTNHKLRKNEVYKHFPLEAPLNVLRNMCLNLSKNDLVFHVDADERLVGTLPSLPIGIYSIPVQGYTASLRRRGFFKNKLLRIFPKTRYKGTIHEYPVLSGQITELSGIYLSNLGYDVPFKEFKTKLLNYHDRITQALELEEDYVLLKHLEKSLELMGEVVPDAVKIKIQAKKEHFDWFKGRR